MDLLRELKAMPVTLHLLQVGPSCPCSGQLRAQLLGPHRAPRPPPPSLVGTNPFPRGPSEPCSVF